VVFPLVNESDGNVKHEYYNGELCLQQSINMFAILGLLKKDAEPAIETTLHL